MSDKKSMYKAHVFVCTNKPDDPNKCGGRGGESLRMQLKDACKAKPWAKSVRVNASGCLGFCERGIAAVIYPQEQWYFEAIPNDKEFILKDLEQLFQSSSGTDK